MLPDGDQESDTFNSWLGPQVSADYCAFLSSDVALTGDAEVAPG